MGFANVRSLVDAELAGQTTFYTWRKAASQVTTIGIWFDLSMSPGNPVPQYYAATPLVAAAFSQSVDGGLFHGGAPSGTKHLKTFCALSTNGSPLPMPMKICDYLLYYPFIDEGTTDEQTLTNIVTLPRYTDGEGVQIMAVSVAGRTGGQTFNVSYTNQDGTAGRTTQTVVQNSVSVNGSIVTSDRANINARGPFIPLQTGDTGVRSIQSVTMVSGADVGLFALVLVKPLAQAQIRGIDAPVEVNYFTDFGQMPVIKDNAYLNMLACPVGSLAATQLHGYISTVWST